MKINKWLSVCLSTMTMISMASCSDDNPNEDPGTNEDDPQNVETYTSGMVELDNGQIHIKQNLDKGGSICYLSKSDEDRSIVNIYDAGRFIQQSYYAGYTINRQSEGQSPNWSPWSWNPIQGGNYVGKSPRILRCERTDNTIYVKCVPMLWDMNNHEAEAIMEQWTSIDGNVVHVRCRLKCERTDNLYGEGIELDQEIPAVYPISSLKVLYTYFGDAPFTNATMDKPTVERLEEGFWGRYSTVPEKWMAFVDDNDWGLAVYSPLAERFLAGRAGTSVSGEAKSSSTSYIAPICTAALMKTSIFEYDYYLIVDNITNIRKAIYEIHEQEEN